MNRRTEPRIRTRLLPPLLLLAAAAAAPAADPWTDAPPWTMLERPVAYAVEADVLDDPASGWHVGAGTLTASLGGGEGRAAYLRWSHLSFARAGGALADRWPELLPADMDPAAAAAWPGEERLSGWGRPEVGVLGRLSLPLLGPSAYAASAWLPLTDDALYPFAARALSLRLSLRRDLALGAGTVLGLEAGHTLTAAMADDVLAPEAYAGSDEAALHLSLPLGRLRLEASYRTGRLGQSGAAASVSLPAGPGTARLGLELNDADPAERLYRTRVRLGWSVPVPPAKETPDEPDPYR